MKKVLATLAVASVLGGLAPAIAGARASGAADAPKVSAALATTLASASSTGDVTVLVRGTSEAVAVEAVAAAGLRQVAVLHSVGVPVAVGTVDQVRDLLDEPGVTYVEQDQPIELYSDTSRAATRTSDAEQLFVDADGDPLYTGAGRSIAIVDGGIDGTHPMFQRADGTSKVVRNLKVVCHDAVCPADGTGTADPLLVDVTGVYNDTDSPSLGGHGTHVASIAAGVSVTTADGRHLQGTAPGAELVGLSVGETLSIFAADVALDWIARNHENPCATAGGTCDPITVVNNSYGPTGGGEFDPSSVTAAITDQLLDAGVVVVWANGNGDATNDGGDGSDNRSNPEGQNPRLGVLSVANYDDGDTGTREGSLDPSSSRGLATDPTTWPDVSAPGTNITAACRPYLAICEGALNTNDTDYGTISGTSMAAPHVAGIVAVLQEAEPGITPAEIEDVLEDTAHKFTFGGQYVYESRTGNDDSATSFDKGHGLVDTTAALSTLLDETVGEPVAVCTTNDPMITDPSGDATQLVVPTPLPSEPSLDVVGGGVSWDATAGAVAFRIDLDDLAAENPTPSTGISFDFGFAYDGGDYYLLASRDATGETGELGVLGTTGREHLADVTAAFDADADTVTITVANDDLAGTDLKAFADGDVLSGMSITSRRQLGNVIPNVDDASAACPFRLGGVAPAPAPDGETGGTADYESFPDQPGDDPAPAPTEPDATLTDGSTFEDSGSSPTDNGSTGGVDSVTGDGYSCDGTYDPRCVTYMLDLQPASSSALDIELTSDTVTDDWDWFLYDADGAEVASSGNPQSVEANVVLVEQPGTYFLVLQPYTATTASTYTVTASLNAIS